MRPGSKRCGLSSPLLGQSLLLPCQLLFVDAQGVTECGVVPPLETDQNTWILQEERI
jgi:hypothetical protein